MEKGRNMKIDWYNSCIRIINPLKELMHMIQTLSLKLSDKARKRLKWMDHYFKTNNAAITCRHFDIPQSTFWFWHKRYDPHDLKSLEDRSKRPLSSPQRTSDNIIITVIKLKKQYPRWGKEKLALILKRDHNIKISGSTVYRICKKHKLAIKYKSKKRPKPNICKLPLSWPKNAPGDLVEIDTKELNIYGKKMFQYTAKDVVSRWRYIKVLPNDNTLCTIRFFDELLAKTPFQIRLVKSDNGSEFKNEEVQKYLDEKRIKYAYIHKGRPQENAYVERSHRTDEEEFYSMGNLVENIDELNKRLTNHCYTYNYIRPHWGIKGRTPIEALKDFSK